MWISPRSVANDSTTIIDSDPVATPERIVYFGTPAAAVPPLLALLDAGIDVALIVSQPDRRRGRGSATAPSPVKAAGIERGIPVVTPDRPRDALATLGETAARRGVVVAFGQLLPGEVLDAFPDGLVNLHFSLLPRWRGAAPVERAILAGDTETGVAVMGVEAGLDTGPVYAEARVPIGPAETAGELHERLVAAGSRLLADTMLRIDDVVPVPQDGEPTYAEKLRVEEFALDPNHPPEELVRIVRAGNPRPGAWIEVDGARLKIWRAHVADGRFVPDEVQPAGKRLMSYAAWRTGARVADPFA